MQQLAMLWQSIRTEDALRKLPDFVFYRLDRHLVALIIHARRSQFKLRAQVRTQGEGTHAVRFGPLVQRQREVAIVYLLMEMSRANVRPGCRTMNV